MATANSPSLDLHASRSSAVVVQRVPPAAVDAFLEWQREASRAAEGIAGYCGTDIFPPAAGQGDEWVVLIRFDDEESLVRWLDSPERARRVEELRAKFGDFDLKTLGDGFSPWFVRQDQNHAAAPASWKMALTVLLALFPTVMLLTIFVGPLTSPLGLAASMLIGNAMSISILQWVVMPRLTKGLDPWLLGGKSAWRATPVLILLTLAVLTALFRQVTG
jgi:antibiotic biosynthesis monooxygenase (ABM) superfamily enzyme